MASTTQQRRRRFSIKGLWTTLKRPNSIFCIVLIAVLFVLVVAPVSGLVSTTLRPEGLEAWRDILASELSPNLLWKPLSQTILLGAAVAIGGTFFGATMAWLVVMTDLPYKKTIGFLASLPFVLPSFAIALAWETVFRNALVGGRVGLLQDLGLDVPNWLAWGFVPTAATLISHYYSLSFLLIAAALASVSSDLTDAGEMAGAGRIRVAFGITLPIVTPAMIAGALLCFAEGVSNFAVPALLGLPVGFQTLSTRLYGAISTGQIERGYVLSIILLIVAAIVLFVSSRVTGRRSYETIAGKGSRRRTLTLGATKIPAFIFASLVVLATVIAPLIVLVASSFSRRTNSLTGGFTTHFWIGRSDPSIAQGQAGVLRNPLISEAAITTVLLGLAVAVVAVVLGLAIGYVVVRLRGNPFASGVSLLGFVPFLIPGIAFAAAYIAQFGAPIGPLPSLYGTFALLVIAGAAYSLPFASQSGRSAVAQVSNDLEEAAEMSGAGFFRRFFGIVLPLTSRSMIAGATLVFVNIVRDISLVILLVTPATPLLAIVTFGYAAEGFAQFANAITVIIAFISIGATLLARRLQGASQPWQEE